MISKVVFVFDFKGYLSIMVENRGLCLNKLKDSQVKQPCMHSFDFNIVYFFLQDLLETCFCLWVL